MFKRLVEQEAGVKLTPEYKFCPTRRWRTDYAIVDLKIAIEIDGGIWSYGRHNRAASMLKDMEKMNYYAALNWIVFHFTPQNMLDTVNIDLLKQSIKLRKL